MARPPPGPSQPNVSFKTVPGRNRTQKWNTARTYDYSGGDWGGYDPYDDYDYEEPPPPMPSQSQQPLPTPIAQYQQPYGGQSFTRPNRQQSFDEGDERRAFSGPGAFPGARGPSGSPARSAVSSTSGNGRPSQDYPRPSTANRPRDFTNPEQVPLPLSMRASPAPGTVTGGYIPPPRKSSISAGSPAPDAVPMPAKKEEKELPTVPFVRPSDIYKRVEVEREKERKSSMESAGRPTMDQLGITDPSRSGSQPRPLSNVYETPMEEPASERMLGNNMGGPLQTPAEFDEAAGRGTSPSLPPVESFGGFGGDMFSGSSSSRPATATPTRAPPGQDPAADILAERSHDVPVADVGQQGTVDTHDPAASIMAERSHDVPVSDVGQRGTLDMNDPAASIMAERTHDVPVSDVGQRGTVDTHDPAASIMAERTHDVPASSVGQRGTVDTHDPAASIMAERTHDVPVSNVGQRGTLDNHDPAASIMAERTHDVPVSNVGQRGTLDNHDPAASILAERTHDAPASDVGKPGTVSYNDPAASILAERTHGTPVSQVGRQPDSLSHQPSSGYRSMVNQAFDASDARKRSSPAAAMSASQSTLDTDVSRSNTTTSTSTSNISPIMSRAPAFESFAPTIAEEPQGRRSLGDGVITPGYRRSLDPPSQDNSPARTPALEDASRNRTVSGGFTAETVNEALGTTTGRPRAGTDYSVREADLAREVNASPEAAGFEPGTAARERESQDQFLQNNTFAAASSPVATSEPVSATRSPSPGKSRVRQLADQYDDASRRNSQTSLGAASRKSSWSNFRGSDENLPSRVAGSSSGIPQRHATDASNVVSESDYGGVEEGGIRDSPSDAQPPSGFGAERPGMGRDMSFRPQMPGEWVSTSNVLSRAETPALGLTQTQQPEAATKADDTTDRTPRASREMPVATEPVDLTPTTRKVKLERAHQNDPRPAGPMRMGSEQIDFSPTASKTPSGNYPQENDGLISQAKSAGTALGASLLSQMGQGHQTRDFGSAQPAQEVEVPTERNATGELWSQRNPERPNYYRGETDASVASTVTAASHDSSSMAPTPAGKEGDAYFAVAPLRTRETSPEAPAPSGLSSYYNRPADESLHRDDSTLRREIVRSLDGDKDDVARTQDALDAPTNMSRVAQGGDALPAAEINDDSPSKPKPLILDQRFSWEKRPESRGALETPERAGGAASTPRDRFGSPSPAAIPRVQEPDSSPEIKPEMPYERPRSRNLHIMNAENSDSEDEWERDDERTEERVRDSMAAERGMEVGLPVGVAGLGAAAAIAGSGDRGLASPPSDAGRESPRLPSYYFEQPGHSGLEALSPQPTQDTATTPALESPAKDTGPADFEASARDATAAYRSPTTFDSSPPPLPSKSPRPGPPYQPTSPTTPTTAARSSAPIPPFRNILALKTPSARIETYNSTRQTFAEMHTGLSDWLATMIEQNPEYANLATAPQATLQPSGTFKGGHRATPSLAKFGPKSFGLGGSGGGGEAPQRSQSVSAGASLGGAGAGASASGGAGAEGGGVDMEKLQQRGKAVMKGAGVLGGKGVSGAKGLLAKGRSRFGTQRESRSASGGTAGSGAGAGAGGGKAPSTSNTIPAQSSPRPPSRHPASFADPAPSSPAPPDTIGFAFPGESADAATASHTSGPPTTTFAFPEDTAGATMASHASPLQPPNMSFAPPSPSYSSPSTNTLPPPPQLSQDPEQDQPKRRSPIPAPRFGTPDLVPASSEREGWRNEVGDEESAPARVTSVLPGLVGLLGELTQVPTNDSATAGEEKSSDVEAEGAPGALRGDALRTAPVAEDVARTGSVDASREVEQTASLAPPATGGEDMSRLQAETTSTLPPPTEAIAPWLASPAPEGAAEPLSQPQTSSTLSPPIETTAPSRSQTPSSWSSASRPLSRTFSRLRERSRSLSRSLSRRGSKRNSRALSELRTVEDAPAAVHTSSMGGGESVGGGVDAEIAPWAEPSTHGEGGRGGWEDAEAERSGTPARLGVLPSPTAGSFWNTGEVDGRLGSAGRDGDVEEERPVTALPVDKDEDEDKPRTAWPIDPTGGAVEDEPRTASPVSETEDSTSRRGSGVQDLTRTAGGRSMMPDLTALANQLQPEPDDGEEELYQTTPTAVRKAAFPDAGDREEDDNVREDWRSADSRERAVNDADVSPSEYSEDADSQSAGSYRINTKAAATAEPEDEIKEVPVSPVTKQDFVSAIAAASTATKEKDLPPLPMEQTNDPSVARSLVSSKDEFEDARDGAELAPAEKPPSRRSSVSSLYDAEDEMVTPAAPAYYDEQVGVNYDKGMPRGSLVAPNTSGQQDASTNRSTLSVAQGQSRPHSYLELGVDASGAPLQETLTTSSRNASTAPIDTSSITYQPQFPEQSPTSPASRLKRQSGVPKGRRPTLTTPVAEVSRWHIADDHGLEGLHDASNIVADDDHLHHEAEAPEKPSKRRSGIWDTLKRTSSRSRDRVNSRQSLSTEKTSRATSKSRQDTEKTSRATSKSRQDTEKTSRATSKSRQDTPRSGTLKKQQRASTTPAELEPKKKKRFSGLGSLFGRSNTESKKPEKSAKLTKTPPARASISEMQTEPYGRREARKYQLQDAPPPIPSAYSRSSTELRSPGPLSEPPEPVPRVDYEYWQNAPSGRSYGSPPPQSGQHHGQGRRHVSAPTNIMGDYRPVQEYYGSPPGPSDQSPPDMPPYQQTYPQRPSMSEYAVSTSHRRRHSSYYDNYQLSPQASGQSNHEYSDWQPFGPSPPISPVQTRSGTNAFPPGQNFDVGPISEDNPMSYGALVPEQQQKLWAIHLPRNDRQWTHEFERDPYPSTGSGSQQTRPLPESYVPRGAPPLQQGRSYQQSPNPYPMPTPPVPQNLPQDMSRTMSPNFSRRTSSGFPARRDGAAAGEEAGQMKGVSYPGQEWTPGRSV
ncbi:uncharacterized protein LTR77_009977 [Saxophila tyrrhenica]|uniref:Uncharacterized protein n=1 Tax=Saxophila tyrrhenica TaxID=1690608 RepID=A0AAV9P0J5_9PEZI|nr:hypothetical protein LTR77_009977 [Saxophila tyrrhenica]